MILAVAYGDNFRRAKDGKENDAVAAIQVRNNNDYHSDPRGVVEVLQGLLKKNGCL